jgi:hypothetical protein
MMYYGTQSRAATSCTSALIDWYPALIQTNLSATSTYDGQLHVIEEWGNTGLIGSTTYPFYLPRDWSTKCGKVNFKEVGVTASFGKLFCENVPSN